jgi:PKD repeat protein
MDKRILIVIVAAWLIASSFLVYQKVYKATGIKKPVYKTSINNNKTFVGSVDTFSDITPGASSWSWDFGDGEYSNEQNTTHDYAEEGEYRITLEVYGNEFGTIRHSEKVIKVTSPRQKPTSELSISGPDQVNAGESVSFSSSETAGSYSWSAEGDPQYASKTQTTSSASYTFATPGTKTISLKTTSPDKAASKTVQVIAKEVKPRKPAPSRPAANPSSRYRPQSESED